MNTILIFNMTTKEDLEECKKQTKMDNTLRLIQDINKMSLNELGVLKRIIELMIAEREAQSISYSQAP